MKTYSCVAFNFQFFIALGLVVIQRQYNRACPDKGHVYLKLGFPNSLLIFTLLKLAGTLIYNQVK